MIAAKLVPGLWPTIHPPGSDEEAASLHSTNSDCQFSHSQGAVTLMLFSGIMAITKQAGFTFHSDRKTYVI